MKWSRGFERMSLMLQLILFPLTAGALAYLSENHTWGVFWLVFFICLILHFWLTITGHAPVAARISKLEEEEFQIVARMQSHGIANIYNMQLPQQQHERNRVTAEEIIKKGNRFCLLSITAASYIEPSVRRHWDELKRRLDDGVTMRVLLLDPFCKEKQIRDSINIPGSRTDRKLGFERLAELHKRYPNVNIRFTSAAIYCALFYSETEMIYDPYHLGRVGDTLENYFFSLQLRRRDSGARTFCYYDILRAHFETQWRSADDIEVYFDRHAHEIESAIGRVPPLVRRGTANSENSSTKPRST